MFSSPTTGFVLLVWVTALTMLAAVTIAAPGCTGPVSNERCDYLAKFKEGAAEFHGYSPSHGIEIVDQGSSVYVQQFTDDPGVLLHTPGVLIDKRSCRVCQVNGYSAIGSEPGRIILTRFAAEQPRLK